MTYLNIPEIWPESHRSVLLNKLKKTGEPQKSKILRVVNLYCVWFKIAFPGLPVTLDGRYWQGFRLHLTASLSDAVTNENMRHLFEIGVAGPDKNLRDWLFDTEMDTRSFEDIVASPWWPGDLRLLAQGLQGPERRRVIKEVDGYLRCIDRLGQLPHDPMPHIFFKKDITYKTQYRRLVQLCVGLEMLKPGHPDLSVLRDCQKVLYKLARPSCPTKPASDNRIDEVETLLAKKNEDEEWAEATIKNYRKTLSLFHKLLTQKGQKLAFDKPSLNVFAEYALDRHDIYLASDNKKGNGWCLRSVGSYCDCLLPFIEDPQEKAKWRRFAHRFKRDAIRKGIPKAKERALCERPMSLEDYFIRAHELAREAETTFDVQVRYSILTVVGILGILLVYPLRRADLRRIVVGKHLLRTARGWSLDLDEIQKTGSSENLIELPNEITRFLDACLLQGTDPMNLWHVYRERCGTHFFRSPKKQGQAYEASAFSKAVERYTGHRPHILRTIWTDALIERGADRAVIAVMLQHKDPISQKDYEFLAGKFRLKQALEALAALADRALAE